MKSSNSTSPLYNHLDSGSPKELMAALKDSVLKELQDNPLFGMPRFNLQQAEHDNNKLRVAGELRDSEDLRFLNFHHARVLGFSPDSIRSHRRGIIGRIVSKLKRTLMTWLVDLLKEHQQHEVEYRAHLVRFLNQLSTYTDARDSQLFWELIHKIDTDITNAVRRIEAIHTEGVANFQSLDRSVRELVYQELGSIRGGYSECTDRLAVVERVVLGIERILATYSKNSSPSDHPTQNNLKLKSNLNYLLLENRFRGSEEEIKQRVSFYANLLVDFSPVLEIGAGRGELQSELKSLGVSASGVDLDSAMVDRMSELNLPVVHGDGLELLAEKAPGSLGGVIAVQVVEHLTQAQLTHLFDLCSKKVRKGGRIIFETINPRSLLALSSNYFRDPTHVWPLHPDTLAYQMTLAGLEVLEVKYLSPVDSRAALKELPLDEHLTPKWRTLVDKLNGNVKQLNDLLYGFQDYVVIATVPGESKLKSKSKLN